MKLTRRTLIASAAAVPALAALSQFRGSGQGVLAGVYDADHPAGAEFARLLRRENFGAQAVTGDRIRMARDLLATRPPMLAGVTRDADALLFAEVGAEEGYDLSLELRGNGQGCNAFARDPEWNPLARTFVGAGQGWLGAFAGFVASPSAPLPLDGGAGAKPIATAWLLTRRA